MSGRNTLKSRHTVDFISPTAINYPSEEGGALGRVIIRKGRLGKEDEMARLADRGLGWGKGILGWQKGALVGGREG